MPVVTEKRPQSCSRPGSRAAAPVRAPGAAADVVAHTDFKAPPAVLDALHQAVDYGVFGYPAGPTDGATSTP
jgi:cysteine-S-conjugate beta-lyase